MILKKPSEIPDVVRGDNVIALVDGKGLNIARVISNVFGYHDYSCINLLGGEVGRIIEDECNAQKIKTENFWISGSSRINTALVYEYEDRMLMINEPGPNINYEEKNNFMMFFEERLVSDISIIISGSAPRGFESEDMMRLLDIAERAGCRLSIDIAGNWLREIVIRSPGLLKINADELKASFGIEKGDLCSMEEFRLAHSIEDLVITDGKNGSVWLCDQAKLQAFSTVIRSGFAVGSGDSFFAGLLYGQEKDMSNRESLRLATACGAANTLSYGASQFELCDVERTIDEVVVRGIEL